MKPIARDTVISLALSVPVLFWILVTGGGIAWGIKNAAVYLILAPVTEEIIFRGGLQEALLSKIPPLRGQERANIITSLIFTLLHLLLRREFITLLVFFPSLVLGWHYGRHRNILAVIFIHFFYNFILFL